MTDITQVGKTASEFLKQTLNIKDVKIIKASKVSDGWKAEAEVYEESSFIKSLGLSTRVQDRNFYNVKLNNSLEVESYEREGGFGQSE
ncbi:MAG: gas vesicle protein [Actinobacteria bacterium]|nr:gas vesicle protein [Actinomycetota bacterium]